MAARSEIESYTNTLLDVGRFRDYGPNGLQVEGKPEVRRIIGSPPQPLALAVLAERVQQQLGRAATVVAGDGRPVRRIAWCTGGAQGYFEAAIAADAYITGEISEPQAHYARETGVAFIACGHHASERFGAPAVAAHVAARFGITHQFIEIDNPA